MGVEAIPMGVGLVHVPVAQLTGFPADEALWLGGHHSPSRQRRSSSWSGMAQAASCGLLRASGLSGQGSCHSDSTESLTSSCNRSMRILFEPSVAGARDGCACESDGTKLAHGGVLTRHLLSNAGGNLERSGGRARPRCRSTVGDVITTRARRQAAGLGKGASFHNPASGRRKVLPSCYTCIKVS